MVGCVGGLFGFDAVVAVELYDFKASVAEVGKIAVDAAAPLDANGVGKLIKVAGVWVA